MAFRIWRKHIFGQNPKGNLPLGFSLKNLLGQIITDATPARSAAKNWGAFLPQKVRKSPIKIDFKLITFWTLEKIENLDLTKIGKLHFEKPDLEKFPCIRLAHEALEQGGTSPAVLNVANDILVNLFLDEYISFNMISEYIDNFNLLV